MYYWHCGHPHFRSNADPFTDLCRKLHRSRLVRSTINVQIYLEPPPHVLAGCTRSFRTDYWLDGPVIRVRVAVDLNRIFNVDQIISLPYHCPDTCLMRTVDFLDMQFNTPETEILSSHFTCLSLQSSWRSFRRLKLHFDEKESVPLAFLRALQSAHGRSRSSAVLLFPILICCR